MKNKILIISLILIIAIGVTWNFIRTKKSETESERPIAVSEDEIKNPDRMVVKLGQNYYEITPHDSGYDELIKKCRQSFNRTTGRNIDEQEIESLKQNSDFVEFDYDRVSKNNIFFFSGDIGVIKMQETGGITASNELYDGEELKESFEKAIKDKTPYSLDTSLYTANNVYQYLPSTYDFEEIKYEAVYKKEITSVDDYEKILNLYNIKFEKIDINELLKGNKIILFLSKYNISDYKTNVGNIKINFIGQDYEVPIAQNYIPLLMVVSKIVNTNCIYYNYDSVNNVDNLTGTHEDIYGVVREKKDDGTLILGYTVEDNITTGIVQLSDYVKNKNSSAREIEVGDWISSLGATVISKENDIKTYAVNTEIYVQKKDDYEKSISNLVKGEKTLDTNIEYYYESESGYDGFMICALYFGENSVAPDGYLKVYYDFYDNITESYLGRKESPVASNYGIVKYEMVTITFTEPVSDIKNIKAKTLEFIAD